MSITSLILSHQKRIEQRGIKPNFLFVGDSVLHLTSFKALYFALLERGVQLAGVICNGVAPGRKPQFNAETLKTFFPEEYFEYLENAHTIDLRERPAETVVASIRTLHRLQGLPKPPEHIVRDLDELATRTTEGAILYIHSEAKSFPKHSLELSVLLRGSPVIEVIVEEGTGTYTQTDASWFEISLLKTSSSLMKMAKRLRWALFSPINCAIDKEYSRKIPKFSFCMFVKGTEPLKKNSVFLNEFQKTLEQTNTSTNYKNVIICATTVLFEECGSDADLQIISRITNLASSYDVRVIVKPHPREKALSRYDSTGAVVEQAPETSLEELVAGSLEKPLCIVGFGSSSQVMLNAIYGIPALDISRLLSEGSFSGATNEERLRFAFDSEHLRHFRRLFSPYITEVASKEELSRQLTSICASACKT